MRFVFANFAVAVWTSGLERSSRPIIESTFGTYRDRLLFTLFRDACTPKPTAENAYGTEKNLQVIFDRYPESFHSVNTIIIDDSPDKCSHPDLALCPIAFNNSMAQSSDDGLLRAIEVLKEVLRLDSHIPLISAAEERLLARHLRQEEEVEAAAATAAAVLASTTATTTDTVDVDQPKLEEVHLWKSRLCCANLQSKCAEGNQCKFSHEDDDGRPCSRKWQCSLHGKRWGVVMAEEQSNTKRHSSLGKKAENKRSKRRSSTYDTAPEWATGTTGSSHTGIPSLDAEIEQQQKQKEQLQGKSTQQRRGMAQVRSSLMSNSGSVGGAPQHRDPIQKLQSSGPHGVTQSRSGGRLASFPATAQPSGTRSSGQLGFSSSQLSNSSTIHLVADRSDGTSLLRQLKSATRTE